MPFGQLLTTAGAVGLSGIAFVSVFDEEAGNGAGVAGCGLEASGCFGTPVDGAAGDVGGFTRYWLQMRPRPAALHIEGNYSEEAEGYRDRTISNYPDGGFA